MSVQTGKSRPQVLLLGNGIIRAYSPMAMSWQDLLKKIGTREVPDDLGIPMPMEIVLRTGDHVDMVLDEHYRELYGCVDTDEFRDVLRSLMDIGFDHILTTNYSYELEAAAAGAWMLTDEELKKMIRHSPMTLREEKEFMLFCYNEVNCGGKAHKIWHIHGEARKPDSVVLGHLYYGNLLSRCREYLFAKAHTERKQGRLLPSGFGIVRRLTRALGRRNTRKGQEIDSWVDAFMQGDVYTMGFGYDFSEMDLWWLLDYKKISSQGRGGKLYYYRPGKITSFDVKSALLEDYGAVIVNFGEQEPATGVNDYYRGFYLRCIEDIRSRVSRVRRGPSRV